MSRARSGIMRVLSIASGSFTPTALHMHLRFLPQRHLLSFTYIVALRRTAPVHLTLCCLQIPHQLQTIHAAVCVCTICLLAAILYRTLVGALTKPLHYSRPVKMPNMRGRKIPPRTKPFRGTGSPDNSSQVYDCKCVSCKARARNIRMSLIHQPLTLFEEAELDTLRANILNKYDRLSRICTKLGEEIDRRWSDYGPEVREEIIRYAGPNLPLHRRPEPDLYEAILANPAMDQPELEIKRLTFLLPYVTVEDLCCDDSLLVMLKRRSKHAPGFSAISDAEQASMPIMGHDSDPIDPLQDMAMPFPQLSKEYYGKLLDKGAFLDGEVQSPPDVGFFMLQTHDYLYDFLLRLTEKILGDLDVTDEALEAFPNVAFSLKDPQPTTRVLQTPFNAPRHPDFDLLDALVSAKAHATRSHLLDLRESPPYLSARVQDWMDHLAWTTAPEGERYKYHCTAAALMIKDAYQQAWHWHAIEETLKRLRSTDPDSVLNWHLAFQELREHLRQVLEVACRLASEAISCTTTFENQLERVRRASSFESDTIYHFRPKASASQAFRRLHPLFSRLCSGPREATAQR